MGDYSHVRPKLAVRSDPPSSYFGYDDRVRTNMMAMDRKAIYKEEDSFNIMKMLTGVKAHSKHWEYIKFRKSFARKAWD